MSSLKRPALGQKANLGKLYDARSDTFIELSLIHGSPPEEAITTSQPQSTDARFSQNTTHKERFFSLGVNAELGSSFLVDLVEVEGSGRYLTEKQDDNFVQASLHYDITTIHEKINFATDEVKNNLVFTKLEKSVATHIVAEITWGARTIITARRRVSSTENREEVESELKAELEQLRLVTLFDEAASKIESGAYKFGNLYEVTVWADIFANDGLVLNDFEGAFNFIRNMPIYLSSTIGGKGIPVLYTLIPVNLLSFFLPVEIDADPVRQPSIETLDKFVQLFDDYNTTIRRLDDYLLAITKHKFCVSTDHIQGVAKSKEIATTSLEDLKLKYGSTLWDVRAGMSELQLLSELLENIYNSDTAPEKLLSVVSKYTQKKMDFVDMIIAHGATYIGFNGLLLQNELARPHTYDVYIYHISETARAHMESWTENLTLIYDLLKDPQQRPRLVLLVDCDATGDKIENAYVSLYRNGQTITEDIVAHRKRLANKSIMRYNDKHLEQTVSTRPTECRVVRIPCPGSDCCASTRCDWICFRCFTPVEYGYSDRFIYCDCGRVHYSHYEFKCDDLRHGPGFEKYDRQDLLQHLTDLEPFDQLNILILGETGVGKSTFINAFINYLVFDSLDDAMKGDNLNYIIPCSFSTQYVDRKSRNGRLVQQEIKIGSSADERDGSKGASATQKTTVYPVTIGTTMIRLIDTPGIGDTRGVDQDRKNMADILSVLRGYEKLHGILILLKPNASRLTVMFKFCIKELLTHLHRNAANNMVFGFTNTRGSNYKPGDTFSPLETLLTEYKDVDLGLYEHSVYCFDSESFRYLAALKQGIDMGNLGDYRRSWEYSTGEAQRLITHFRSLMPHQVKSTLNLNETRNLIQQLTKPMAEIAQMIKRSIQVNEDSMQELKDKRLGGADLLKKLHVQKMTLHAHKIDMPRTVCANNSCVEYHNNNMDGVKDLQTVYKMLCHDPCYLDNIEADAKGCAGLIDCAAFTKGICDKCGHNWQEHLHILYELRPEMVKVKDNAVQAAIRDNESDIKLKELAIAAKQKTIDEYQKEHDEIQAAAVKFSLFLKKWSITPYNDATLEYLEFLIKEEKGKVAVGGPKVRLNGLEEYRGEYQQLVDTLEKHMDDDHDYQPLDEDGVEQLVKELFSLKHYGDSLRRIRQVVEVSHAGTHREKPYRVHARSNWLGLPNMSGFFGGYPSSETVSGRHSQSSSLSIGYTGVVAEEALMNAYEAPAATLAVRPRPQSMQRQPSSLGSQNMKDLTGGKSRSFFKGKLLGSFSKLGSSSSAKYA